MSLVHHVIKQLRHIELHCMTGSIQTQHCLLTCLMSPRDTKCTLIAVAEREVHLQQVWCDMALRYPRPQPALRGHPRMLLQGLCGI